MSENTQETDKLLAIKDIIFGDQIKEYNSEFETLKAEMEKQKQSFDEQIKSLKAQVSDSKKELSKAVEKLERDVTKEITSLKENKAERKKLSKLFADISEKISE